MLPAPVAGAADRLARFQREAEVLAALNHPNIAAIYGLEKSADCTALVVEPVEGEDLSERINRGATPIDDALPIADAPGSRTRAGASSIGTLTPANIKVRADGTARLPEQAVTMAERFHRAGYQTAVLTANPNAATLTDLEASADFMHEPPVQNDVTSSVKLHEAFWNWRHREFLEEWDRSRRGHRRHPMPRRGAVP